MTPTALLILQICAAHATQVPLPHSNIMLTYSTFSGEGTYTSYATGFDDCAAVVPELTRQKQAEEQAAADKKYRAEHAAEIKDLQKALDQIHKEQPNTQVRPFSLTCSTVCPGSTVFHAPDQR